MRFRFDDVSVNTDIGHLNDLLRVIARHAPGSQVLLAISPVVFAPPELPEGAIGRQRVHPPRLTAMSELSPYYRGTRCGVPSAVMSMPWHGLDVRTAGHGIAHVDHRLLGRKAQEMSILMSCSLAFNATTFVPPYNHYDARTEEICAHHAIELVKFEHGWRHVLHNPYTPHHERFYLHPYDITASDLQEWFLK